MNKKITGAILAFALALGLWGCGRQESAAPTENTVPAAAETEPVIATVPQDGNEEDVTCKGSYTVEALTDAVAATIGDTELTNRQLSVWYRAQVAQYQKEQHEQTPDFDRPLDTQDCPIDSSVNSWQQYFLKQALNTWHAAQALALQGQEDGVPTDETYKPIVNNHKKYMTGMPATSVLHGYNTPYQPNTLHQAYLDQIPGLLQTLAQEQGFADAKALAKDGFGTTLAALEEVIRLYNYGYMYFTQLSYVSAPTEEEIHRHLAYMAAEEAEDYTVDIRHILLVPDGAAVAEDGTVTCAEETWTAFEEEAAGQLKKLVSRADTALGKFADYAYNHSQDTGSAVNGGAYRNLKKGQLSAPLDAWCFDPARAEGDSTIVRSEKGLHLLYFCKKTDASYAQAREELAALKLQQVIAGAKNRYPAQIDYSAIALPEADSRISFDDLLYPDVAHQRYPEVPVYLQQDYPGTKFGAWELRTHGCGITTMSMLATYMTDEEWTPPEMCARYGRYSYANGTDGMIFINEPPVMGFYLREKTYEPSIAKQALADGHIVVSIQHKGYWTSGGHYILLEKLTEDGLVQVRDSNIFNYGKIKAHLEDKHTWGSITSAGSGYWIFEPKVTRIPACGRCGEADTVNAPLTAEYICEKCEPAMLRRNAWLNG